MLSAKIPSINKDRDDKNSKFKNQKSK